MTQEEATAKAQAFESQLKAAQEQVALAATKEELEAATKLVTELAETVKGQNQSEAVKALEATVKEQGEEITSLLKNKGAAKSENFETLLEKALTEALPELKAMKAGTAEKGKELVMTIKAPVNVTTGAVDFATGVETPANYVYQQGMQYADDVRRDAYIINFMDNGTTDKASLPYMDKLPNEGTMEITAEGALKPLISVTFEIRYSQAKKIAGRTKISEEALDDIPGLMATINNELRYEHDIAEQEFIFTEIDAIAGAFVAGNMAASTDAPSNYDAIRAAVYAVKIASKGRYIPNAVLVPSSDVYNMGATKDANENYVMPAFVLPDGSKVSGVQVVEVNDDTVAVGSFIVGDFRKLKRRMYKSFTVRLGQGIQGSDTAGNIVSDFESNMYTVIGESRQHLWIYENEKVAFVKSTFAAVKTAIEAV